jgi:hypothetical protein
MGVVYEAEDVFWWFKAVVPRASRRNRSIACVSRQIF